MPVKQFKVFSEKNECFISKTFYPRLLFPVPTSTGITQYLQERWCMFILGVLHAYLRFSFGLFFRQSFALSKSFTSLLFIPELCYFKDINRNPNILLKGTLNRTRTYTHNKKHLKQISKYITVLLNLIVDNLSSNVQKYIKIICYKTGTKC